MSKLEKAKQIADYIPQMLVKVWDWATDGNQVARREKELNDAQKAFDDSKKAVLDARKNVHDKETSFNTANQNLTDREQVLRQSQDYLSNVITHPDIQRLFDAAANATDPLTRSRLSEQLVKRLTPYYVGGKGQYARDPQLDRALAFLDYMQPRLYQNVYSRLPHFTVDDVYDAIFSDINNVRDFTKFSTDLLNRARLGVNNAQAAHDAEQLIARTDPAWNAAQRALSDAHVGVIDARAAAKVNMLERNQARINHENAIANQARKLRNTRIGSSLAALGGLGSLGYALYPSSDEGEANQDITTSDIQGKSPMLPGMMPQPSLTKKIFNVAAGKAMVDDPLAHMGSYYTSRNSDWTPDDSALEYIPDPDPTLMPKPTSVSSYTAPVQVVQNTKAPTAPTTEDKTVIPDGLYSNSIKGTREWLAARKMAYNMASYKRESARNALPPGMSPAEGVQRGIIPYEALQYF